MNTGIFVALIGYGLYSLMDGMVKFIGPRLNPFEIGFFLTLFSGLPLFFSKPANERWRDIAKARHPYLILLRAGFATAGGLLSFYSFGRLPLADVYALIFLMPMMVTVLSSLILKEQVGWRRISLIISGFLGMLLVVKPGFRELQFPHLTAGLISITGASATIILRRIVNDEQRVSLMGIGYIFTLVFNGVIMMILGFVVPSLELLLALLIAGILAGFGGLAIIHSMNLAPATYIAPTQYSQIVWAVAIGIVFYQEYPDGLSYLGMVIIALSGFLTFIREEARFRWWSKMTFLMKPRL